MNLKYFEASKQNTTLRSSCFHDLASTHQICAAVCRKTAGHMCCGSVLRLTHDLTGCHMKWMACQQAAVALVPQSGLWPSVQVSLRVRDIIVSVLVVLKSLFVDVEDFDRVVSAGTGKLDPGALLLDFTLSVSLSILVVVVSTCSASHRPPAEPLYRQGVALSAEGCDEGKQQGTALDGNEHRINNPKCLLHTLYKY